MKRKIISLLLCAVLGVSLLGGCGNSASNKTDVAEAKNEADEDLLDEDFDDDDILDEEDDFEDEDSDDDDFEDDLDDEDSDDFDDEDSDDSDDFDEEDNGGILLDDDAAALPSDLSHGMTLHYPQIDTAGLDNTAIGWGMGPDRDELNRPMTALHYQTEYQDYNVDFIIPDEEKKIYLTFDEGYENGYSESILDTLKRHGAKGIFFVTKPYAESRPDLVQRMIDDGHIVGNHTVHHPSDGMQAHDIDYQTNEVTELHDYIRENFHYHMCLFRYPTGMFSKQSLAVVSNCGYRSVFWSFAYADWDRDNQPNPTEALNKLESSLHPGAIYLLHAVSSTNDAILDEFLNYVEAQGYEIGNYYETLDMGYAGN